MEKELTPKQQTSEALRQADSILIMTAQRPNVDQVAGTIALASILRKYGKKVAAVISDDVPANAKFLPMQYVSRTINGLRDFVMQVDLAHGEVDSLKYTVEEGKLNVQVTPFSGGFQPSDVSFSHGDFQFDLVVIVGVAAYGRIDKAFTQNQDKLRQAPLVNIDTHRSNEQYGAINLVEPNAASTAEVLIALSESLQTGLVDGEMATTMLAGLMAATDRFTATNTTSKTMTVAAQMMAIGADQQRVVRGLYRGERSGSDRNDSTTTPKPSAPAASAPRVEPRPASAPAPVATPTPVPPATPVAEKVKPAPQAAATNQQPAIPINPKPEPQPEQVSDTPVIKPPTPPAVTAAQPSPAQPTAVPDPVLEPTPEKPAELSELEELLPPQHIEEELTLEPLINAAPKPATPMPELPINPLESSSAALNPTNNPNLYPPRGSGDHQ